MDMINRVDEWVCVFATTNMPWELDIGAMRRFERKILVGMPDRASRSSIMELHAGPHHILSQSDFDYLARQTEGYSGSDLSALVNDALMRPIKQLQLATKFRRVEKRALLKEIGQEVGEQAEEDLTASVWMPVFEGEEGANDENVKEMDLAQISEKEVFVRKADLDDFKKSMDNNKPTIH
mmetsp:Transcript_47498/g.34777  ORF Transcript_47498/g.34777 Transcript_47498/m.34777 type:complete len:180 (+) Transcript_47498:556-1095(+)